MYLEGLKAAGIRLEIPFFLFKALLFLDVFLTYPGFMDIGAAFS